MTRTQPPGKLDLTVVPAYGRNPTTATQTMHLWLEGKDFRIADVSSPWNGAYTSIRDHSSEITVKIRYNSLQDFLFVKDGVEVNPKEDEDDG